MEWRIECRNFSSNWQQCCYSIMALKVYTRWQTSSLQTATFCPKLFIAAMFLCLFSFSLSTFSFWNAEWFWLEISPISILLPSQMINQLIIYWLNSLNIHFHGFLSGNIYFHGEVRWSLFGFCFCWLDCLVLFIYFFKKNLGNFWVKRFKAVAFSPLGLCSWLSD